MLKESFHKKRAARLLSSFYNKFYCIDYPYFEKRYKYNIKILTAFVNDDYSVLLSCLTDFNKIKSLNFNMTTFVLFHVVSLFNKLIYHHPTPHIVYFQKVYSNSIMFIAKSKKNDTIHIYFSCDNELILIPFAKKGKFIRIELQAVLNQVK